MSTELELSADILWGVGGEDGIAAYLKIPASKAYYLIRKGVLPVHKHGHRTITASKRELRQAVLTTPEK